MKLNIIGIFLTSLPVILIVFKNIHAANTSPSQVVPKVFEQIEKGNIKKGEQENLLKDLNNLQKEVNKNEEITVSICGDIEHSRVARSNYHLLKKMGSKIRFVTPDYFKPKDLDSFDVEYFDNLELGIESVDIVMMLRIQKERINDVNLPSIDEYFKHFGLTHKKLTNAKKDVLVMHPGPINRNIEIESSLADDLDKSVINEQVENGVAVRMACLAVMVK